MSNLFVGIYFFLLFYIAVYGFHLYWLIFLYLTCDRPEPVSYDLPADESEVPIVTVQLPIYNERAVALRLITTVAALDWPADRLEIQVLDDSDDDTAEIIAPELNRLRREGLRISHLRRGHRVGYKAGALAHGLNLAGGEFIAVFDADNLPRPDFLTRLMGYFKERESGLVQARWSFLNRNQSLLCRAQALFLDAHFLVEQSARSRGGLFMNFNGTAGIWRRKAIEDAGGWQSDTLTEDLDLSYRAQLAGWKMRLAEDVDVPTELPAAIRSFKTQQYRWARGAVETGRKVLPQVFASSLPWRVKVAALFHLTHKTVSLALPLLAILLIPALYVRLEGGMAKLLLIDLPIFLAGTGSMSIFYGLAYKRIGGERSWKNSLILPVLTSLGVALAVNNSRALAAAFFGEGNTFVRTPKTGSSARQIFPIPDGYRISFDRTVFLEMALAGYSLIALGWAAALDLYFSLPFLATFAFGYLYFTFLSIKESHA